MAKLRANVWSSSFYLIPALYALSIGNIEIAVLCLIACVFSSLHHWHKSVDQSQWWWQKNIEGTYNMPLSIFDSLFAVALSIATVDYALASRYDFSHMAVLLGLIIFSLTFIMNRWKMSYSIQHSLWHLTSALVVLFVLI